VASKEFGQWRSLFEPFAVLSTFTFKDDSVAQFIIALFVLFEDGVTREVGCVKGDLPLGVPTEFPTLEKYEKSNNKLGYRIVFEREGGEDGEGFK